MACPWPRSLRCFTRMPSHLRLCMCHRLTGNTEHHAPTLALRAALTWLLGGHGGHEGALDEPCAHFPGRRRAGGQARRQPSGCPAWRLGQTIPDALCVPAAPPHPETALPTPPCPASAPSLLTTGKNARFSSWLVVLEAGPPPSLPPGACAGFAPSARRRPLSGGLRPGPTPSSHFHPLNRRPCSGGHPRPRRMPTSPLGFHGPWFILVPRLLVFKLDVCRG